MTMRHVINRIIVLIIGVGLIDGVIGEMHEVIGEIRGVGELI